MILFHLQAFNLAVVRMFDAKHVKRRGFADVQV